MTAVAPSATSQSNWRSRVRAYVGLTKPRIIELLLVTTVPAMVLADKGVPSPWLVLTVLFGGTLAAGGANTINCVCDRDIDEKMKRTHGRPLPLGLVTPESALRFGIGLEIFAFIWLWATTNLLAATLAVSATAFYVFVYTMWLKRTTAQNIVIGGAAGAVPVLVGVTLTLCPAAQMGPVYLVAALVLGARFLQCANQLNRDGSTKAALRLFSYSITYLGLLFAAIAVDAVVQQRF